MKLPKQLPAVERKTDKSAAVPEGASMNPAAWWEDALRAAPSVIGGLGSLF